MKTLQLFALSSLLLGTAACGGFAEALEAKSEVEEAVKTQLQVDATVSFHIHNTEKTVTVRLKEVPNLPAPELKQRVIELVQRLDPDADEILIQL